jgi:hypothetical protein
MPAPFIRLLLVVLFWLGPCACAMAEQPIAYQVKAAFLYKFVDYVAWPAPALDDGADFSFCIVGSDAFAPSFNEIVQGQRVGTHSIRVKRLDTLSERDGCRVAYLAGLGPQQLAAALKAGTAAHTLTVTDDESGDRRGIINFVIRDSHVRFEIDDRLAADSGLTISSKLMNLAVSVRSRSEGNSK